MIWPMYERTRAHHQWKTLRQNKLPRIDISEARLIHRTHPPDRMLLFQLDIFVFVIVPNSTWLSGFRSERIRSAEIQQQN